MTPEQIERHLDRLLLSVVKPGRYVGGEYNSVRKDWQSVAFRAALAFPDIYDLGMSNLGLMILYDILNKQPDMLAERVYCPWLDMEALMRQHAIPLYSLESKRPIREFDLLGISLPYEQLYTNAVNLIDLAGLPSSPPSAMSAIRWSSLAGMPATTLSRWPTSSMPSPSARARRSSSILRGRSWRRAACRALSSCALWRGYRASTCRAFTMCATTLMARSPR